MTRPTLDSFRRIVVKVGSSLLVDPRKAEAKRDWLAKLADDIAALHHRGADVLVVSSGAVALGRSVLGLPQGPLPLEDSQAAAAVGQIALARLWSETLGNLGVTAGQVLVTLGDTEQRRRYLYARECLNRLLALRAVPVINENDTVATAEIRYGDNDRLAARVATMASADLLVLLSDVDGLYTAPPASDPSAKLIEVIPRVTAEVEAMAGGAASLYSRGGMRTKIEAAKIATTGGAHMVIADGRVEAPLSRIAAGGPCSWFLTSSTPVTARKKWIAGSLEPKGIVHIDAGAERALYSGKSLLPAGVTAIEGGFSRGECVVIRNAAGGEIGRGLVTYDATDALRLIGRSSREIEGLLGFKGPDEVIHRDDMALNGE
ncbi:glutamate 5-kinase [Methylosinus trichosporium OB3b]|uniref:Glutamate 5-kinase n=1 Tax=Methylosinus trichosporium (strain ATCC 35070 / NCIMB 11131 / UNIQEM 75 / OB3b) TaxID=595536 RepID=A0A2D2CVK4_METT3|nr:glutamate 5-kinase [Methylosinus trichosporium]ATQ66841.1 glutamate 5-kinase [Methylosinus trichosporium OB3b]